MEKLRAQLLLWPPRHSVSDLGAHARHSFMGPKPQPPTPPPRPETTQCKSPIGLLPHRAKELQRNLGGHTPQNSHFSSEDTEVPTALFDTGAPTLSTVTCIKTPTFGALDLEPATNRGRGARRQIRRDQTDRPQPPKCLHLICEMNRLDRCSLNL